ncbi:MAG: Rieske (2Fe-2S) protein [Chloroflexota bacterium]
MSSNAKLSNSNQRRARKQFNLGPADLQHGERRVIDVDGRSIGLFNVNGEYFALHNRCPHMGGNLCAGPVTGTALYTDTNEFVYGRHGELVRCGWHGWEFEIATGQCLVDERMKVRTYPVTQEAGQLVIHI